MTTERFLPASPLGPDGPFLQAILDVLDDIRDMLDDRLPAASGGEPVPVEEPAPRDGPRTAVPLKEPAPSGPPANPGDDEDGPVRVTEPAPAAQPTPSPPPRAGRGASLEAWQRYAIQADVAVEDGMTRDDIIAACELAGVIDAK